MREIEIPERFKRVFQFKQKSRIEDEYAHVSEVIYCLRKSKQSRMLGEAKEFEISSSMAIRRGLALEANFLRPLDQQAEFIDRDIIATLDGTVPDETTGEPRYAVELKTRAIAGYDVLKEQYIDQVVLYEYISHLRVLLIVYSCFVAGEGGGTDKLQFFVTDESDYETRGVDWMDNMQERARVFLKSVREEPQKLLPPSPRFDWECSYCDFGDMCPKYWADCYIIMTTRTAWSKPAWMGRFVKRVTNYDSLVELKNDIKVGAFDVEQLKYTALKLAQAEGLKPRGGGKNAGSK